MIGTLIFTGVPFATSAIVQTTVVSPAPGVFAWTDFWAKPVAGSAVAGPTNSWPAESTSFTSTSCAVPVPLLETVISYSSLVPATVSPPSGVFTIPSSGHTRWAKAPSSAR